MTYINASHTKKDSSSFRLFTLTQYVRETSDAGIGNESLSHTHDGNLECVATHAQKKRKVAMKTIVADKDKEIKILCCIIDSQKTEILLLRKILNHVRTKAKNALELSDSVNETVNSNVGSGIFLSINLSDAGESSDKD